jgi:hypothetical protein
MIGRNENRAPTGRDAIRSWASRHGLVDRDGNDTPIERRRHPLASWSATPSCGSDSVPGGRVGVYHGGAGTIALLRRL